VLYKDEFVVAVSKTHPLANKRTVSLRRIVEEPFIMHSKMSHLRRVFDHICAEAGLSPKVIMELENEEAMETMIELNMGVTLLSKRRAINDRIHHLRVAGRRIYCDVTLVIANREYIPKPVEQFSTMCRAFSSIRAHA
jgi:DNA-binding transcriptional LysR family regulator